MREKVTILVTSGLGCCKNIIYHYKDVLLITSLKSQSMNDFSLSVN